MPQSRFSLGKLAVWTAIFYALFDWALFRTGFYFRYVEPQSVIGSVLLNRTLIQRRLDPLRSNILVLGDSRVSEGFSGKLANTFTPVAKTNYIGCGISGSTPRIWRYFLRWIDPDRRKFSAIVLMAPAFTDDEIYEDLGNRTLDLNYCVPLVSGSELRSFPATFSDPRARAQARWAVLFPLIFLQSDVKALLSHPITRMRKVPLWRSGFPEWAQNYPGRPEALPQLRFMRNPFRPLDWNGMNSSLKPDLERDFIKLSGLFRPLPSGAIAAYRRTWFGGIAADYAATGVPVYIFLMPRGPYYGELVGQTSTSGSFAGFGGGGTPRLLDPKPFYQLEIPANFFDHAHLNAIGREKLTRCLVQELTRQSP